MCHLIGLPFTIGAIVRAVWLRFRITIRRICHRRLDGQGEDESFIPRSKVRSVSEALARGDMVLVLNDGARLEMRSVPSFRETEAYILERMAARSSAPADKPVEGFAA